jgi:hypothetical protein
MTTPRGGTLERADADSVAPAPARATRPGWAFAANLMPPELVLAYRVRRLRERIVLVVCLVVLLSAAGFAYGFWRLHQADGQLQAAQSQAAALHQQTTQYAAVTRVQGTVAQVRSQLGQLLSDDVDVAALIGKIRSAAPAGVHITGLTVTVTGATDSTGPTGSLDTSAAAHIGTIEIQASGSRITDAASFADALAGIGGLVDVLPTSNTAQTGTTDFTLEVTLTDALLSHRFDPAPPTAQPKAAN